MPAVGFSWILTALLRLVNRGVNTLITYLDVYTEGEERGEGNRERGKERIGGERGRERRVGEREEGEREESGREREEGGGGVEGDGERGRDRRGWRGGGKNMRGSNYKGTCTIGMLRIIFDFLFYNSHTRSDICHCVCVHM